MSQSLPFSQAAENNKLAISETLKTVLRDESHVLEIGSCTGQHAVHMGRAFPKVLWQPSDVASMKSGLCARLHAEAPANVRAALALDVMEAEWPLENVDVIYAANVVHIISKAHIEALFRGVGKVLNSGGLLILYGPYKYGGNYTSDSNARFDLWLKERDRESGIRHFEYVDGLARAQFLSLQSDTSMPTNNQLIIWQKD